MKFGDCAVVAGCGGVSAATGDAVVVVECSSELKLPRDVGTVVKVEFPRVGSRRGRGARHDWAVERV